MKSYLINTTSGYKEKVVNKSFSWSNTNTIT